MDGGGSETDGFLSSTASTASDPDEDERQQQATRRSLRAVGAYGELSFGGTRNRSVLWGDDGDGSEFDGVGDAHCRRHQHQHRRVASVGAEETLDSENDEAGETADREARRRVDWRVLPVAWLMQFTATLEFGNLANVNIPMASDLGISQARIAFAITILYIATIALALPANLMLRAVQVRHWLPALCMLSGVAAACTNFVNNDTHLLVARGILGAVSAGILPALLYVVMQWYRAGERGIRIALLFSGTTVAGAAAGLIADGALNISGAIAGWRYVFIIEGAVIFAVGLLALLLLPKPLFPSRDIAFHPRNRVKRWSELSWSMVVDTVTDANTWLFALLFYCTSLPAQVLLNYLPYIMQNNLNLSTTRSNLYVAPLYLFATLILFVLAWVAEQQGHVRYLVGCCVVNSGGFVMLAFGSRNDNDTMTFAGSLAASCTAFAACAIALGWLVTHTDESHTSTAVAAAVVIAVGNLGGIVGPEVYGIHGERHAFFWQHIVTATHTGAAILLSGVLVLKLRSDGRKKTRREEERALLRDPKAATATGAAQSFSTFATAEGTDDGGY